MLSPIKMFKIVGIRILNNKFTFRFQHRCYFCGIQFLIPIKIFIIQKWYFQNCFACFFESRRILFIWIHLLQLQNSLKNQGIIYKIIYDSNNKVTFPCKNVQQNNFGFFIHYFKISRYLIFLNA